MQNSQNINHVGVIGGGLIGLSWACLFAARGKQVTIYDTRSEVQNKIKGFKERAWPYLERLGWVDSSAYQNITFADSMSALSDVGFIQECVLDEVEAKQKVICNLEEYIDPGVPIASSTSGLIATDIQASQTIRHPERIMIAHPLNPPHLISQVEIVAGEKTSDAIMELAKIFYEQDVLRDVIYVKKEMPGHLMNVFNSTVFGQAYEMVDEGYPVKEVEEALTEYLGARLSFLGMFQNCAANAGDAGFKGYVEQIYGLVSEGDLGLPRAKMTKTKTENVINKVEAALGHLDLADISNKRDEALVRLAELKLSLQQDDTVDGLKDFSDPKKAEIVARFEKAIFAAAYNTIVEDIASVEDIEKALQALSARWNFFGSLTTYAIGGGEAVNGGDAWFRKYMTTIGKGQSGRLQALPDLNVIMNERNNNKVIAAVDGVLSQDVNTDLLRRGQGGVLKIKEELGLNL